MRDELSEMSRVSWVRSDGAGASEEEEEEARDAGLEQKLHTNVRKSRRK